MFKKTILGTALALSISTIGLTTNTNDQTILSVEANSEVQEKTTESSLQERLKMLELSIIPTSPAESVDAFAKAVKSRNGAWQYALLSNEAKAKVLKDFEASHWVTGVSSPWVETYKIISEKEIKTDKKMEYVVEFNLFTSTGKAGTDQARLTLEKLDENWLISNVEPVTKQSVGIWKTYNAIDDSHIENILQPMETYKSVNGYSIQIPTEMMKKIKITEGTCEKEEGNPPCTFFYYKDEKQKKDVFLISLIRLNDNQLKSAYYKEHPFLTFADKNDVGSFYIVTTSEHPYGEMEHSNEGKEWSDFYNTLKERLKYLTPNS